LDERGEACVRWVGERCEREKRECGEERKREGRGTTDGGGSWRGRAGGLAVVEVREEMRESEMRAEESRRRRRREREEASLPFRGCTP
jgi:hypothetical protein